MSKEVDGLGLGTDEKTERLLNLVIALLGTKSFMKKSEILRSIPGYSGSLEARERMFERDKEDLRRLGIPIQVSSLDPLFDDEQGYRISRREYGFQLGSLSAEQSLVVNAALQLIQSRIESFDNRRLKRSIASAADGERPDPSSALLGLRQGFDLPDGRLIELFLHIQNQNRISFSYQSESVDALEVRVISPRAIGRKHENWLLIGFDHGRGGIRTFNVFQILGQITTVAGSFYKEAIDLEGEFEGFHKDTEKVLVRVETRAAPFFEVEGGRVITEDENHAELEFTVPNRERLLRILLSINSSFQVISPDSAKVELKNLKVRLTDGK